MTEGTAQSGQNEPALRHASWHVGTWRTPAMTNAPMQAGRSQRAEGWERREARLPFHLSNGTGSGMKRTGRGSRGENQSAAARIDVPGLWRTHNPLPERRQPGSLPCSKTALFRRQTSPAM